MKDFEHFKADSWRLRLSASVLILFLMLSGSISVRAGTPENSLGAGQEDAGNSPPFEIKVNTFGWDEFCGTNKLPGFKDPNTVPNLHLEGNWILKEYEDGRLIGINQVSFHKSHPLVLSLFYTPSRSGRREEPWRFMLGHGWRIDKDGNRHESNAGGDFPFGVESGGAVTFSHGDKVVVTLHPDGSGGMSGEWKEDKNWTNTHRSGTATFHKVAAKIESIKFIGDKTDSIVFGERAGRLEFEYQGPQYGRMRGNRRRVSIQIFGENLWGCHRLWIDPIHHLEVAGAGINGEPSYPDGVRVSIKGASIGIVTWPEMFPGRKVLWIDDIPIPFDLVLNNYPKDRLALAERINESIDDADEDKSVEMRYVRRRENGYETLEKLPFYEPIYVELAFKEEPKDLEREVSVEVEGASLTLATRKISATLFRSTLPFWLEPEQEAVLIQP